MPVKLLQITDCHLGETKGEKLLGLDSDESLGYVLSHMYQEQDMDNVDLLLCTGDLSNEAGISAYERLIEQLPDHIPQAWLPGNHDENECMAQLMAGNRELLSTYSLGKWQVTLLDSSIPNKVPGLLESEELQRALDILEAHPDKHHLMFMHHHLKPVGCAWLDTQVVGNADEVLERFSQFPQLKMVICGHVHQDTLQEHNGISLYSTPSTCIQFKPNSDDFAVGTEMPGYRWIELNDDGTWETDVSRIPERDLNIEWNSKGY